jgi:hypothetical protein
METAKSNFGFDTPDTFQYRVQRNTRAQNAYVNEYFSIKL